MNNSNEWWEEAIKKYDDLPEENKSTGYISEVNDPETWEDCEKN